jgi:hypothetical protein
MKEQKGVPENLFSIVAQAVGMAEGELARFGTSYGMRRIDRPKNTWAVIQAMVLSQISRANSDARLWARNGDLNRKWIGSGKLADKDRKRMAGTKNAEEAKEVAKATLARLMRSEIKARMEATAAMYAKRYVTNESKNVIFERQVIDAEKKGVKWVYIPKTQKGYLDECKDIEGRWYRIGRDKIPVLPVHTNCKHYYVFDTGGPL